MSFETRMVTLLNVGGITAIAGARIYAIEAPPETLAPFVVWQRITSAIEKTHDGADTQDILVQISCYAKTFAVTCALRDAVRTALDAGDAYGRTTLRDVRDTREADRSLYRSDIDFDVWQA
jgi:Protein of unknown function (DUF3168)